MLASCGEQTNSSASALQYPESDSEQAKFYIARCSGCHAAPLPSVHNATHWPGVVQRMQQRMKTKAIKPLDKQEFALVIDYLQKHAKDVK